MSGVTGRDSQIIDKALFYAAHFIAGQPELTRESSDREDMIALLHARLEDGFAAAAEEYSSTLEQMTGRPFEAEGY